MSIVYVIQDQQSRDPRTGELKSRFDISSAAKYGEFKFLLGSSARPFEPEHILEQLRVGLEDFTEEDHLLLIGNPNFILWIGMLLGDKIDRVNTLQWNMGEKGYIPISAQVFDE